MLVGGYMWQSSRVRHLYRAYKTLYVLEIADVGIEASIEGERTRCAGAFRMS